MSGLRGSMCEQNRTRSMCRSCTCKMPHEHIRGTPKDWVSASIVAAEDFNTLSTHHTAPPVPAVVFEDAAVRHGVKGLKNMNEYLDCLYSSLSSSNIVALTEHCAMFAPPGKPADA
jgi:hypothetical protein